jgi:hypothetical protein
MLGNEAAVDEDGVVNGVVDKMSSRLVAAPD